MKMDTENKNGFSFNSNGYIVAIGASAGGLEPINEFFDNMPANTGLSFVIIQHLSPDHKSMMAELLSKHTSMQVFEAAEGMRIKGDSIYLIPARKLLTVKDGCLWLRDKARDYHPMAIDVFFESLAIEKGVKAVGIILSGTGTDGTKGIEHIKNMGGTVIVQDPLTAEFNGMPNSAVNTGYADLILAPDMMPYEMNEFLKEAPLLKAFNSVNLQEENILTEILNLILKETRHDFHYYKRPTITRRLAKRMAEKNISRLADYHDYLIHHKEEVKALCSDFLINVTAFFRDDEAFEVVKTRIIPALFENKKPGEAVKMWIVACSTGEEAYSMAMLFEEYTEQNRVFDIPVKIFATDLDEAAIEAASRGVYKSDALKLVSYDRREKFFTKEGNSYRVVPSLRRLIVFARHDIAKDPPYSKIDFLSCRNMLIYINPILQKSILSKFHFALVEQGYLFLGPSENIGILKDVMDEVDRKWKIYLCISKMKSGSADIYLNPLNTTSYQTSASTKTKNALSYLPDIFSETVFEEQSYAGILVDKDVEVKQAIGNFKKFLRLPENKLNFNLLKLVPNDLSLVLNSLIRKAIKDNVRVSHKRIKVVTDGKEQLVDAIVKPYLSQKNYLQPFLFIVLKESEEADPKLQTKLQRDGETPIPQSLVEDLENELRDTKENLQAIIEEVETSHEELLSSNEEIVSSNEELQSTNEELQSLNEELHTVNAEHQSKIKELIELNEDLNNYFNNTEIGQILVDRKLTIRRFTPVAKQQVNLIETDIGRSIADISTNFKSIDFINFVKEVMRSGEQISKEMELYNEQIFMMRIAPFIRQDGNIDGVVISFINITEIKRLASILEAVFNSSTSGISAKKAIRNAAGEIVDFEYITENLAVEKIMGVDNEKLAGKQMLAAFSNIEKKNFDRYVGVVNTGITISFEFQHPDSGLWYDVVCVKLMDGLVTTFTDITQNKEAAILLEKGYEELKVTSQELEKSNFDLMQFASIASHDLKEPLRKIQAFGNLLRDKVKGKLNELESKYLDKVISASERMQTLVDDILTLSKLSNNVVTLDKVSLADVLHQIIDDLEITIKEKRAVVHVGVLPVICGVTGQMHQLFLNLIVNALKFNKTSSPAVSIYEVPVTNESFHSLDIDHPENFAGIIVEDNGIGFDQMYAEKIFGIFQRLSGAQYSGTGIGLAICKKIVENHKGFIKAESKEGEGAKFMVALPR